MASIVSSIFSDGLRGVAVITGRGVARHLWNVFLIISPRAGACLVSPWRLGLPVLTVVGAAESLYGRVQHLL